MAGCTGIVAVVGRPVGVVEKCGGAGFFWRAGDAPRRQRVRASHGNVPCDPCYRQVTKPEIFLTDVGHKPVYKMTIFRIPSLWQK